MYTYVFQLITLDKSSPYFEKEFHLAAAKLTSDYPVRMGVVSTLFRQWRVEIEIKPIGTRLDGISLDAPRVSVRSKKARN